MKLATYLKSLVPSWTYLNKNSIHLRSSLWHLQIDRIPALCPLKIATRVCRILARWSLAPELSIRVPMLCVQWSRQCPELTEFNKGHKNTAEWDILRSTLQPSTWLLPKREEHLRGYEMQCPKITNDPLWHFPEFCFFLCYLILDLKKPKPFKCTTTCTSLEDSVSAPLYVTMRQIIQLHDVSVEAGVEQVCYVKNVLIKSPYHTAK